ncbi:hypothetical protein ACLM44_12525 [Synechococcus sp. W2B2]|uniref:hypothetical protein n=1 Tax=Synechococcus sp. W2B2 TaxID=3392296 RepID=UPI00006BB3AF|nr:possible Ribosomal L29e protein family protein [Synechococcus sp. WH 7805]
MLKKMRSSGSARLSSIMLIPCVALSAITLHQSETQAQSFLQRRIQERMQERRLQEEAKLTESQKQQLFQVRREWLLSSHDQRLALLQSTQACLKDAQTFQDGKECRSKRRQAGRKLLQEGRQVVNAERQRLGLSPLPTDLPFSF